MVVRFVSFDSAKTTCQMDFLANFRSDVKCLSYIRSIFIELAQVDMFILIFFYFTANEKRLKNLIL